MKTIKVNINEVKCKLKETNPREFYLRIHGGVINIPLKSNVFLPIIHLN